MCKRYIKEMVKSLSAVISNEPSKIKELERVQRYYSYGYVTEIEVIKGIAHILNTPQGFFESEEEQ